MCERGAGLGDDDVKNKSKAEGRTRRTEFGHCLVCPSGAGGAVASRRVVEKGKGAQVEGERWRLRPLRRGISHGAGACIKCVCRRKGGGTPAVIQRLLTFGCFRSTCFYHMTGAI